MFTIVPMLTAQEIEGKAYVHWKAWQETYTKLLPAEFLETRKLEQCRKWAFDFPQDTFVAKIDDKVVGFVCCASTRQEGIENTGEVYALYVLEAYHGQGIGYRLMRFALEELKAFSQIVLWVAEGNERAIHFYEAIGFRFDGTSKVVHLGKEILEKRMVYRQAVSKEDICHVKNWSP